MHLLSYIPTNFDLAIQYQCYGIGSEGLYFLLEEVWYLYINTFFKNASFWFAGITTEPESDLVYYIIIILGALFIISLVILLIILYKKGVFRKCKRRCCKSSKVGPLEIIMSKPPLKVQPLYLDEPLRRDKTDVISVLEFNTNFNFKL